MRCIHPHIHSYRVRLLPVRLVDAGEQQGRAGREEAQEGAEPFVCLMKREVGQVMNVCVKSESGDVWCLTKKRRRQTHQKAATTP